MGEKDEVLKRKLLKQARIRRQGAYKKCSDRKDKLFKEIDVILRSNYKITNEKLFEKLEISKATFYKNYAEYARKLRKIYKSQSLF